MPELQEDLQALADRRAAESTGDFESVLVAARTRKRRRTAGLTVIGAAAVVAAVAIIPTLRPAADNAPVAGSPIPTNAVQPPTVETQPSTAALPKIAGPLALRTSTVASGAQFVVGMFPDKAVRAATFALFSAANPTEQLYTLVAKVPGDPMTPYAFKLHGEMGVGLPSYTGAGPYTLAMPKGLPAGAYQVCTLTGARLCSPVTVK
ncbi:hypothetical protein [Kribbella sp.]|uniref:hypothetical protein n=1 Tax=Kribbella sp. TaxID=1871183 RepID=UPI002D5436D3|nr:hypothetical protein [Kribbella sp.]HZX05358.1 hypothetical protein [Kribbella sp.]